MRSTVLVAAVLLALCATPTAARAALPLSVLQDDAQLLHGSQAAREAALDDADSLGVDVLRVLLVWRDAERDPGRLPALEAVVAGAEARGMQVLLTVSGPGPAAASTCRPRRDVCAPDPRAFGAWVAALGRRLPSIRRWSIWNEPNNPNWLQPQHSSAGRPVSPGAYRALVRAAVAGLRSSGHGRDLVLAGETAPMPAARSRPPALRPVPADRFLGALLAGTRPLGATGLAHHPYATDLRSPFGLPQARQFTLAGIPRLQALVRGARRRGVLPARAPVWLTELGFQTNPPDPFFGVGLRRQADWLGQVDARATRLGVAAVGQYLLRDEADRDRFQSGLRFADGRAKPSWAAYRLPLAAERRGGRTVLRGRVRPAGTGSPYAVEHRPRPGAPVRRVLAARTGPRGAVSRALARRRGEVRLVWTRPGGRRFAGAWTRVP